ncbi:MAG: hypothetical protein KAG64_02265 [Bacteroidales bacterium]|nr:hypothetical protein [Bacteroidales bacterium]
MKQYFKTLVFIIFLLVSISEVKSQSDLKQSIQQDISRIDSLIQKGDLVNANLQLKKSIAMSQKHRLRPFLPDLYWFKGGLKCKEKLYRDAFSAYYRAYAISVLMEDSLDVFMSLYHLSKFYVCSGDTFDMKPFYIKSLEYLKEGLPFVPAVNDSLSLAKYYYKLATAYSSTDDWNSAVTYYLMSKTIAQNKNNQSLTISILDGVSRSNIELGEYPIAINYLNELIQIYQSQGESDKIFDAIIELSDSYYSMRKYSDAVIHLKSIVDAKNAPQDAQLQAMIRLAKVNMQIGEDGRADALEYLNESIALSRVLNDIESEVYALNLLAVYYNILGDLINTEKANKKAVELLLIDKHYNSKMLVYSMSIAIYKKKKDYSKVSEYQELYIDANKQKSEDAYQKLNVEKKETKHLANTESKLMVAIFLEAIKNLNDSVVKREAENRETKRDRNYLFAFVIIGLVILIIVVVFYFSLRKKSKALVDKNNIIIKAHKKTEDVLLKLKKTQAQLIESERLASLGELTAGIAHEIRNPLNFVNNFSSLNVELSEELQTEIDEHIKDEELLEDLSEITDMISNNSKKINDHGERASRIIKQMLDSSRKGSDHFEETEISLLVEETAKLAYQGVRGKYINFSADMVFDFDKLVGRRSVAVDGLGRVIINLVTNSCHALLEKAKTDKEFKPKLLVQTKDAADYFDIIIEDNGIGMSDDLKAKIFDPFFTTKPTGEGTGLGLTMSFDILTNVHKGSIIVESKLGEFTRFTLRIPKKKKSI